MARKTMARKLTVSDILPLSEWEGQRIEKRRAMVAFKRQRRVAVGPYAVFLFENLETMRYQVQEMLYIEKGGQEQLTDELDAYNPLIPNGMELVATVMFEIDSPIQRKQFLNGIGGIEEHIFMTVSGEEVECQPERDLDRTNAEGKASSVHFVHFVFTPSQIRAFCLPGCAVGLGVRHANYAHETRIAEPVRKALAEDFAPLDRD